MSDNQTKNEPWTPPVSYYFKVCFQGNGKQSSVSFAQVNGLKQEIAITRAAQLGGNGSQINSFTSATYGHIELKRALEPLNEEITKWIKDNMLLNKKLTPLDMVIFLMDKNQESIACWLCSRVLPMSWSINEFNGEQSGLAIETLVLACDQIERKK